MTEARHTVLVLGERGPMSPEWEATGAAVGHLGIMGLSRPERLHVMKSVIGKSESDGIVIWHGMAELPALLHALSSNPGPVLIHGGNPALGFRRWTDLRYLMMEKRWPHSHDPIYVCCSHHVSESFDRSLYLRRFRRCVIHNGVEHENVTVHRPRHLSPGQPLTIGMMARLDSIKDHSTLIRAMPLIIEHFPAARLELAGDGEEMPSLKQLVMEMGVSKNVVFLGSISNVYETIAQWDIFAYAATPREGFGNAVAEALMCALPCVVTDLPPLREVCGSDTSVIYVQPGDSQSMAAAVIKLITDFTVRAELSKAAQRWAEAELSAEVYARRYQELFRSEQNRLAYDSSTRQNGIN